MLSTASNSLEVACVCGGYGFPHGISSARRVLNLGRSFLSRGIPFRVLHCGTSPTDLNHDSKGTFCGIPYEYTTGVVARPRNAVVRGIVYVWGYIVLARRLWQLRKSGRLVVYLFLLRNLAEIYVGLLCRILGIPVVQDVCEWWPGTPQADPVSDWIYYRFFPRFTGGAVAISAAIEERLRSIAAERGVRFPVLRVPLLLDAEETPYRTPDAQPRVPYAFWLGSVDSYLEDALFVVRAVAHVNRSGLACRAVLAGPVTEAGLNRLRQAAAEAGLPEDALDARGFVDDEELRSLCRNAAALLMPLWDDDRSVTRYPHKLTEYLMAGRPVVTSEVGEAAYLLKDGVNALFCTAGDARSCGDRILELLRGPAEADTIGAAGRKVAEDQFDFRVHAGGLERLCREVAACPRG